MSFSLDKDEFMKKFVNRHRVTFITKMETEKLMEAFTDLPSSTRERVRCRLREDGGFAANSIFFEAILKRDNFAAKFINSCDHEMNDSLVEIMREGLRLYEETQRQPLRRQNISSESQSQSDRGAIEDGRRTTDLPNRGPLQESETARNDTIVVRESAHLTPSPIISSASGGSNIRRSENQTTNSELRKRNKNTNITSNIQNDVGILNVQDGNIKIDEGSKKSAEGKESQNQNIGHPLESQQSFDENVSNNSNSKLGATGISPEVAVSGVESNKQRYEVSKRKTDVAMPVGELQVNISNPEDVREENNLNQPCPTSKKFTADKKFNVPTTSPSESSELRRNCGGRLDDDSQRQIKSLHQFDERPDSGDAIMRQGSNLSQESSNSDASFYLNTSDLEDAFPGIKPTVENEIENLKEEVKRDQELEISGNNADEIRECEAMPEHKSPEKKLNIYAGTQCSEDLENLVTEKKKIDNEQKNNLSKNIEIETDDNLHPEEYQSNAPVTSYEADMSQTIVKEVYESMTEHNKEIPMPDETKMKYTFSSLHPSADKQMEMNKTEHVTSTIAGKPQKSETKVKQVDDEETSDSEEEIPATLNPSESTVLTEMNQSISTTSEASDVQRQQSEMFDPVTKDLSFYTSLNDSFSATSLQPNIPGPYCGDIMESSKTGTASADIQDSALAHFSEDDDISADNSLQSGRFDKQSLEEMNASSFGSGSTGSEISQTVSLATGLSRNSSSSSQQVKFPDNEIPSILSAEAADRNENAYDGNKFLVNTWRMLHHFFPEFL